MATAAVFFDKAHPRKDGTCAISIRVIHERLSYLFPVKIRLSKDDFKVLNTSKKLQDASIKINHRLKTALDIIKELDEDFTWDNFREMFQSNKKSKVGLKELFEEHINNKKKYGSIKTAVSYQTTYNSLVSYRSDLIVFAERVVYVPVQRRVLEFPRDAFQFHSLYRTIDCIYLRDLYVLKDSL